MNFQTIPCHVYFDSTFSLNVERFRQSLKCANSLPVLVIHAETEQTIYHHHNPSWNTTFTTPLPSCLPVFDYSCTENSTNGSPLSQPILKYNPQNPAPSLSLPHCTAKMKKKSWCSIWSAYCNLSVVLSGTCLNNQWPRPFWRQFNLAVVRFASTNKTSKFEGGRNSIIQHNEYIGQ